MTCPVCEASVLGDCCDHCAWPIAELPVACETPDRGDASYGNFQKHKKLGETACQPCIDARNAYMKGFRHRNPDVVQRQVRQEKLRRQAQSILAHRRRDEYLAIISMLYSGDPDTLAELREAQS